MRRACRTTGVLHPRPRSAHGRTAKAWTNAFASSSAAQDATTALHRYGGSTHAATPDPRQRGHRHRPCPGTVPGGRARPGRRSGAPCRVRSGIRHLSTTSERRGAASGRTRAAPTSGCCGCSAPIAAATAGRPFRASCSSWWWRSSGRPWCWARRWFEPKAHPQRALTRVIGDDFPARSQRGGTTRSNWIPSPPDRHVGTREMELSGMHADLRTTP